MKWIQVLLLHKIWQELPGVQLLETFCLLTQYPSTTLPHTYVLIETCHDMIPHSEWMGEVCLTGVFPKTPSLCLLLQWRDGSPWNSLTVYKKLKIFWIILPQRLICYSFLYDRVFFFFFIFISYYSLALGYTYVVCLIDTKNVICQVDTKIDSNGPFLWD